MFLCSDMALIGRILAYIKKRGIIHSDIFEQWAHSELRVYGQLNYFQSALFLKMFTLEIWCQMFLDGLNVDECKGILLGSA